MAREVPDIALNNGVGMPSIGFGVFQTPPDETRSAVAAALDTGYRHIDTAAAYGNEREVGEAVHASKGGRAAVFLETKIWISDYGYDETLHGFDKSAGKLGVDQIDLLILHQALPSGFDKTLEAYRALETLLKNGKVRAIGVSNFMAGHLTNLVDEAEVVPAVNQIELHPYFQQPEVQSFNAEHGIVTQAWSPIGGITFYREGGAHQHPGRPGHRQDRRVPLQESRAGHAALAPAGGTFGHPEVNQAPPHRGELRRVRLRAHYERGRGHRRARYRQARRPRAGRHHPGKLRPADPGGLTTMTGNSTPDKVAVVTGASSGIGAATARALGADGYRVALLARRLDRITTLADELGNGSTAIEADVTDRDSIVAAADRVRQELGTAGVLINNAGVMLLGPFGSGQRADYRQMIEVNLLGAITATEVFLDQLKDGGGDIINISSVAGRTARSGNGVYAATKRGINGWSESLRQELLPDVRVTLVEPGVVATELPNHITHPDTKHGVQQLYDKAEVTSEDIAEIIAFILSRPRRLAINEILLRPAGQQ